MLPKVIAQISYSYIFKHSFPTVPSIIVAIYCYENPSATPAMSQEYLPFVVIKRDLVHGLTDI